MRFGLQYSPNVVIGNAPHIIGHCDRATIAAPLIAPHSPNTINPADSYNGASLHYLLGQDDAGRDIFSRLIYGARLSLLGPAAVVVLSLLVGIPAGLPSGRPGTTSLFQIQVL